MQTAAPISTRLTTAQLQTNAEAMGFDPSDRGALAVCAMISDPDFRERLTRFYFERALAAVRAEA